MSYHDLFKNKRITLMGLGLLGRGVGDAIFLAEAGADLTVTDLKSKEELAPSLKLLKKFKDIKFVLGEHRLQDFQHTDLIMKAAGVPLDSIYIKEAEKNHIPVALSAALFAEYTEAKVIGITGTRGKSTVAYLLEAILKEHYDGSRTKVFLGGNVLGVSTLALLPLTGAGDIVILELDSWQLQGFGGTHQTELPKKFEGFSPVISVFTTFMPDHLNYYQNDLARYFADKANIYRFQNEGDVFVVSEQVVNCIKRFGPKPKSKMIVASPSDVPESWTPKIIGEHNRLNIALAMAVAKKMDIPERTIEKAVEKFKAAPGRLELIRKFKGIEIYNDTNATTPEATIAGLRSFENKNTVLIFGGADKKLDTNELINNLPGLVKALVVLPGSGTDLIKKKLEEFSLKLPVVFVSNMPEAVNMAINKAENGDQVLMSPGFASFGLFKNEYDRGDQFNELVKNLK